MLPFGIFALLALAGIFLAPSVDIPDDTEEDTEEDPVANDPIGLASGDALVGTDGVDTYVNAASDTGVDGASIASGGGDDVVNLAVDLDGTPTEQFTISNVDIDAGAGNDTVTTTSDGGTISGGDGDDILTATNSSNIDIFGDAGSDTLSGSQQFSDALNLYGGDGDDTLDGSAIENGEFFGGAGDDDITLAGANDGGAGYAVSADGGDGDDTIMFNRGAIDPDRFQPSSITGGVGDDTFILTLNEGGDFDGTPPVTADGAIQLQALKITDFNSADDVIVVDGMAASGEYALATARLETLQDPNDNPYTALVMRYESDTLVTRDVIVDLGSADVAVGDISFTGDQTPTTFTDDRAVI